MKLKKIIKAWHCEACGRTDPEAIEYTEENQGYSSCCNEPVVDEQDCVTCMHD